MNFRFGNKADINTKKFALVERFNGSCNILVEGTEEEVDNFMPIALDLCTNVSEVYKVDITDINQSLLSGDCSKLSNVLNTLV